MKHDFIFKHGLLVVVLDTNVAAILLGNQIHILKMV